MLMQRPFLFVIVFLSATLGGCQHGQRLSSSSQLAIIKVVYEPPQTCLITVEDQTFTLPADETSLRTALKLQAARYPAARVDGDVTTPFKCFGYAVFVAQGAGFKRVGFIAEPPPTATKP